MKKRVRLFGRTLYIERRPMKDFGWFEASPTNKSATLAISADLDTEQARLAAMHEASHAIDWLLEEHRAHATEVVMNEILRACGLWGEE